MKKKNLLAVLLLSLSFGMVMTACGEDEDSSSKDKKESEKEKDDSDEKESDDDKSEGNKEETGNEGNKDSSSDSSIKKTPEDAIAVYSGVVNTYEAGDYYDTDAYDEAELAILDDSSCVYSLYTYYADNCKMSSYTATYEEIENGYRIEYFDGWDYVEATVFVTGNSIVKIADMYSTEYDYSSIAGRYSLDTEIGQVVFEVDEDGLVDSCVTVNNKKCYDSSLIVYDYDGEESDMFSPEWDLMFSYDEMGYDWYIYFGKNSVTYVSYREAIYGQFAGTYEMDGQLGTISVVVDKEGNAETTVKIDGKTYKLEGGISYDYYYDMITFSFYSDDLELYLELDNFDDGYWYRGYYSITKELAAG